MKPETRAEVQIKSLSAAENGQERQDEDVNKEV